MNYGKWIDQLCLSRDDWNYYRDEARKLAQLATDYWAMFQQSPEGRALLAGVKVPNDPMPVNGTHRQILTWLYGRADFIVQLEYRAGFDSTDGHLAAQIWNSQLTFIPPTKEYQHAA